MAGSAIAAVVEHAREAYGVVLNAELEIDGAATAARRGEMRG